MLGVIGGFIFLEVDENQHTYGYGAELSCDMRRMNDVVESINLEFDGIPPKIYWLRYNPHTWRVDGKVRAVSQKDRLARLVKWLENFSFTKELGIGYAFYDCTASGTLKVLENKWFIPIYKEVVDNLEDLL